MEFHCLRWEQLPQIALYMDQVLLVLNQALEPLAVSEGSAVTGTMINNYVKKVLSMAEIATVLERLLEQFSLEQAYALFCRELEARLQCLDGPDSEGCPPVLAAAIRAVACKIRVEQLIEGKA